MKIPEGESGRSLMAAVVYGTYGVVVALAFLIVALYVWGLES